MISLKQRHDFGKSAFITFNNPDFVTLAESFGTIGYSVKSAEEFPSILEKAKKLLFVSLIF